MFPKDKRLWAICLTSSCFEGSMYLWIFFKFPALKLSHVESGLGSELPFGESLSTASTRQIKSRKRQSLSFCQKDTLANFSSPLIRNHIRRPDVRNDARLLVFYVLLFSLPKQQLRPQLFEDPNHNPLHCQRLLHITSADS